MPPTTFLSFAARSRRFGVQACTTALVALGACASAPDRGVPPPTPQRVTVRIHAGDLLNTDASGRSLTLVAKMYALKDADAFLQAPYDAFKGTGSVAGATEVREIVLTPGRRYEAIETLPDDVRYLAVVGLFRAPDDKRWRFAFDVKTAAATGITLGAHGCALSVSEGQPMGTAPESMRLAGVRCR